MQGAREDGLLDVVGDGEPDGVGQPPARRGEPGQEVVGAADRSQRGSGPAAAGGRAAAPAPSRVASMWSAAVFEPAFPGRSRKASGSPLPSGAVISEDGQRVMAFSELNDHGVPVSGSVS